MAASIDITKAKNYNQKPTDSGGFSGEWSGETVDFSAESVIVLNSLEELLDVCDGFKSFSRNYYYINFDLTVYRGSHINSVGENWTWKRWLDHNKMGTVAAMGFGNVQPTTLVFQEALAYASVWYGARKGFEIYSMDIKDYIVSFPRRSQSIRHSNCNPVTKPRSPDHAPSRHDKVIKCDQKSHMKLMNASSPVIFIYGGVKYEDMTVVWDNSIAEIVEGYDADENTEVLNAEWFTWYSGQYVLVRNVYRIYNRSVVGEEIVLPEEYSLLDDAVEELVNLIEYDPSIFEMGVYKIQSGMDPKVTLEVKYKHQEFSGDNPEAVKLADEKSYDRWNKDYLIDEPDDFLIGATDIGDIISEVFVSSSEDKKIKCQNCNQEHDLECPQCGQPTCNKHFVTAFNSCSDCFKYLSQFMSESVIGTNKRLHFMDPKRRLRKLIKDIDIDPETAAKRISFNSER